MEMGFNTSQDEVNKFLKHKNIAQEQTFYYYYIYYSLLYYLGLILSLNIKNPDFHIVCPVCYNY